MAVYYNEIEPYAAQWLRNLIAAGHIAPGDVDERSIVDVRPDDLEGYTQCHFFAGLGGWSLALRLAGWGDDEPVWTGSCPCQPFSSAGKRLGYDDERDLWPAFFRLIDAVRPPVVFGEQVASADVIGRDIDADMHAMWGCQAILDISQRLQRPQVSSLQGLHDRGLEGVTQDQTSVGEGEQEMAGQESGVELGVGGKGPRQSEESSVRDHIPRDTGTDRRRVLRGDRDTIRSGDTSGLELPVLGSDRAGQRIYARQYQGGHLRLQRDGERLGRAEDHGGCQGLDGSEAAELQRLIREIGREVESGNRLEWITRIRIDLERCGYAFGSSILAAASAGAPHIRQRLYWVADAAESGRSEQPERFGFEDGRSTAQSGRLRGTGGLADAGRSSDECRSRPGEAYGAAGEDQGAGHQRQRSGPDAGHSGAIGGLAESGEGGRPLVGAARLHEDRPSGHDAAGRGSIGGMGDTECGRPQSRDIRQDVPASRAIAPSGGFWSDYAIVPCTDGKARRFEPGSFPLAHGVSARVGRLRAYGNAIVPAVAAAFIQAACDAIGRDPTVVASADEAAG